ncbi:hypothetical protein CT0861_05386 [Colletotrichum tofieldiae]|uniref:Uncharacterized protein n=1 Tax=Colletotrichum tofieldiae TaxID=708197 RepID=A0A161W605_9PEZI|nr:hypothetical protein CT0861_05386 [Colletotrichum tofieldiae]GKT94984.1 hypothetical protein Ct61P_12834 [Colletotrichum tofieldiae]
MSDDKEIQQKIGALRSYNVARTTVVQSEQHQQQQPMEPVAGLDSALVRASVPASVSAAPAPGPNMLWGEVPLAPTRLMPSGEFSAFLVAEQALQANLGARLLCRHGRPAFRNLQQVSSGQEVWHLARLQLQQQKQRQQSVHLAQLGHVVPQADTPAAAPTIGVVPGHPLLPPQSDCSQLLEQQARIPESYEYQQFDQQGHENLGVNGQYAVPQYQQWNEGEEYDWKSFLQEPEGDVMAFANLSSHHPNFPDGQGQDDQLDPNQGAGPSDDFDFNSCEPSSRREHK